MEGIWGKLNRPTPIPLTSSVPGKTITKSRIRQQVWDFLEKYDLVNFPRPVHNRIPNFKGAPSAGKLLASLTEFKKACVVKVNPDKPQEEVRYQVLDHKKTLLVPTPRLRSGLFNLIEHPGYSSKEHLKMLASRQGLDNKSKPLPLTYKTCIDLVVIGCVAVDKLGHRLGKGEGFADLEFAMAASMGSITADTTVVATVHDCQLFDSFPEEIFGEHDVPIDIIVTPTTIHRVERRLPKPNRIMWEILSAEKMRKIPILKRRQEEERLGHGRSIHARDKIKEYDYLDYRDAGKTKLKGKIWSETRETYADDKLLGSEIKRKNPGTVISYESRKLPRSEGSHHKDDNYSEEVDGGKVKMINEKMYDGDQRMTYESRNNQNDYKDERPLIYVGRIPKNARVRDLKDAMLERNVRPKELVWKGFKGFAFLYFDISDNIEEILESLKDLQLGDRVLDIQKEK